MKNIHLYSSGGTGDQMLAFRLRFLLEQINKDLKIHNYCCCRDETYNMLKIIYPDIDFQRRDEDWFYRVGYCDYTDTFVVYPDKLFRGIHSFPLKDYNITNFLVKQTRTLLGKWKPENYISLALNSITPGYTYHSIPELASRLAKEFPKHKIYLPLITSWNNQYLKTYNFIDHPENLIVDVNPEFSKVYDILCKSKYCVCTDNAMMHICHDLGMPYLTLDPQFNRPAFAARWRPMSYYNSVAISSLVDDILHVVKTQINIPETQMLEAGSIYRNEIDFSKELIFKE